MPENDQNTLDISVGVCTRNREGPIRNLLESITRMEIPKGLTWEVVVVDNGSSDGTRDAILSFSDRLPIVYLCEPTPGVANARNRLVEAVRGRYICWTDDDAELDPKWLVAYTTAFKAHPDAALFGGKVVPVLQPPTPNWFGRFAHRWPLSDLVALRDFGDQELPLDTVGDVMPWGVNHAIRTADQRRFSYDPNLGVSPVMRRSGEETEMMFQLMRSGAKGWWVPSAQVRHIYPPNRQSRAYFFKHYAAIGETKAYLDTAYYIHHMNPTGTSPRQVCEPAWKIWFAIGFNSIFYVGFRMIGLTLRSFYHLRRISMNSGYEAYRKSFGGRPIPRPAP